jgi:dUTP pyrophosphatase
MNSIEVKIINKSHHAMPEYATPGSAGMDVRAFLPNGSVTLKPLQRALVPTGLYMQLPQGYECQIRPRSGLALKHGLSIVNAPGTIDSDYRGEIGVMLINLGQEDFTVNDGERICQMVVQQYTRVEWVPSETLDNTERSAGGFGHTGTK